MTPSPTRLAAHPLEVRVDEVVTAEQLTYGGDVQRNALAGLRMRGTASSQEGNRKPEHCADGRFGTSWSCKPGDAEPWVKLEPSRAMRSNVLLLSHALPQPMHVGQPRAKRVRVELNRVDYGEVLMDPDVMVKTVFKLEKILRVREIRLTVLECYDRPGNRGSVGFSEIELQNRLE